MKDKLLFKYLHTHIKECVCTNTDNLIDIYLVGCGEEHIGLNKEKQSLYPDCL